MFLARRISVGVAGLAAVGALIAACPAPAHGHGGHGGHGRPPADRTVDLQMLAINDFHGNLEPPAGSSGSVNELEADGSVQAVPAGGVEYLASSLRTARKGHERSLTVAAGDLVGASPLLSGLFHDEPTVEAMNRIGLDVTGVGNHEFDEGKAELLRLQNGGCHPVDGCYQPGKTFPGADYPILSANVVNEQTGRPLLRPYVVKNVKGVQVGFIGVTLKGTPNIVTAAGVAGLKFLDEAETVNKYTKILKRQGVNAVVALIHEGGVPVSGSYNYDCDAGGAGTGISGPIVDIAKKISPDVDALVTGHTHNSYVCTIPDPAGRPRLVTSASSFGRLYTELDMKYDVRTHDIVRTSVKGTNHVVDRVQPKAADMTALIARWNTLAAPVAGRTIGWISADIGRTGSRETPLGDLIADAQLAYGKTLDPGTQLALMNPGGIRTDLVYPSTGSEGDGVVTYAEGFAVQPFSNTVNLTTLTGAQIIAALQQQVSGANLAAPKILQISAGLTYTLDTTRTGADQVVTGSVELNGTPIDPAASYRVAENNFLAGGGDGFTALGQGTDPLVGGDDLAAFAAYLTAHSSASAPIAPPAADRVTVVP
ncbi:5'-nucleotidase [Streptomyces sp. DvalAA-14]|uniref:bifunctional metallophosphatase/5'-nucleotidase n=1 Tax=unclassified Streptomyces TaxID=2593676 RepID=UPI00081B53C8|nr:MULTISPECIES: bifunctional metallophosphatase/5'-nucleotidase [unclassified Streptomyces]MYS22859.1 bifunctional metallophosphatase/5'-nucleotidase [Streptomyces sp. SID4948]SCE23549.1 5'-nucleotidase [Streptomyces sp. DvalAA-14]